MKLTYALLALFIAFPSVAFAQPAPRTPPSDAQHQALASLAGNWTVQQSFWTAPGAAPKIDRGAAQFAMVLNRQHLRQSLRIADGTRFEGLGYIGYDNASGQFFSTWMDVNFPGLVVARGAFDEAAGAYVFRGSMPTLSGEIPVREVMTIADRDHFKYEYFETRDGAESLTVRLEYTRRP